MIAHCFTPHPYRIANRINHRLDLRRIVAITRMTGSVPDGRMTKRPLPANSASACAMTAFTVSIVQRLAAREADIFQKLRNRFEQVQHLACGLARSTSSASTCSAATSAVAGRGVVEQDHMPRLLTAHIHPARAHFFKNIAVANLGAYQLQMLALPKSVPAPGWT